VQFLSSGDAVITPALNMAKSDATKTIPGGGLPTFLSEPIAVLKMLPKFGAVENYGKKIVEGTYHVEVPVMVWNRFVQSYKEKSDEVVSNDGRIASRDDGGRSSNGSS